MTGRKPTLTPTERQVLLLVVGGLSNYQIRERMGLGIYALPRHLNQLYRKSGIHRPGQPYTPAQVRQALIAWGQQYLAEEEGC